MAAKRPTSPGRRLSPGRQALEDRLMAILRDAAPMGLSTTQIGVALGAWEFHYAICGHEDICREPKHWAVTRYDSHPNHVFTPLLRSLVKRSRVEQIIPEQRTNQWGAHYWRYLGADPVELPDP